MDFQLENKRIKELEHTYDTNGSIWPAFFVINFLSKTLWASKLFENSYQKMQMIDILLKYILWYEFSNDLDAKSDFDKKITKKWPSKTILLTILPRKFLPAPY